MRYPKLIASLLAACSLLTTQFVPAAYVIEIDTDGAVNGSVTFNANFAFGGDTTIASTSVASPALGLTGGDSLFGGNGALELDTYEYFYTPTVDGDNLLAPSGTVLNTTGDVASGLVAGEAGVYAVYGAWPATTGVSGNPVTFTLLDTSDNTIASVAVNQNNLDGQWFKLFNAPLLDPAATYTLRQQPSQNSFVSMRSAGVLFDLVTPIPEPTGLMLIGLAAAAVRRSR
ncbi:MAG: hypothetical protein AAFV43_00280 [Planctomycetota bacterium]